MTRSLRFTVLLTALSIGCGVGEKPADSNHSEAANRVTDAQPAQQPVEPVDTGLQPDASYPVPNLEPPALLNYINQLATMRPKGTTDDEYLADQVSRAKSRLIAADRIILSPGIEPELLTAAVKAKLDALKMLALLDPQGLGVHFKKYIAALTEASSPEFAQLGRVSGFWFEVDKLMYGQTDAPEPLVTQLKELLEDPAAGEAEFLATQDAGFVLNDRGFQDQATEVLKLIGQRFIDHEQLGDEARDLLEQTEFREKVIAAMDGHSEHVETLFTAIQEILGDKANLDLQTLDNVLNAAQVLEYNGHFEDAGRVFSEVEKAFRAADDEKLAKQAEISVAFAKKRLGVIGQEVEIEGTHIDGQPFHWEPYKGKVVLIDFWASTSSAWLANLPGVKAAYDRFHDEGFEVIGINVDKFRENAYDFLKRERLPWPMLIDEVAPGLEANPNAIRYGIQAVPFVMLVGRDGKVADIHVRGPALTKRVAELLGLPGEENAAVPE